MTRQHDLEFFGITEPTPPKPSLLERLVIGFAVVLLVIGLFTRASSVLYAGVALAGIGYLVRRNRLRQ